MKPLGILATTAVMLALATLAPALGAELKIGGTGSALGVMNRLGEALSQSRSEVRVTVLPSLGSGGGIRALIARTIDIAVSARAPKDKEQEAGLVALPYGRTPLAFVISGSTRIDGLTSSEIPAIYRGERLQWPSGETIRLVLRPDSETDFKLVAERIEGLGSAMETARRQPGVPTAYNDQENVETLLSLHGALGTVTLSQVLGEQLALKTLALDGVMPSVETLRNGSYPLWKSYWIVTRAQASDDVEAFIALLRSETGQRILEETGHDSSVPAE